jgi:hypothetical protein
MYHLKGGNYLVKYDLPSGIDQTDFLPCIEGAIHSLNLFSVAGLLVQQPFFLHPIHCLSQLIPFCYLGKSSGW